MSELRERGIGHEDWYKLLDAKAGASGEIEGQVYVHDRHYEAFGLLHFEDPQRSVGMVAEADVLQQVTGSILQADDWAVQSTHINLDEFSTRLRSSSSAATVF